MQHFQSSNEGVARLLQTSTGENSLFTQTVGCEWVVCSKIEENTLVNLPEVQQSPIRKPMNMVEYIPTLSEGNVHTERDQE